jgi:hypothetical protein
LSLIHVLNLLRLLFIIITIIIIIVVVVVIIIIIILLYISILTFIFRRFNFFLSSSLSFVSRFGLLPQSNLILGLL